MPGPDPPQKGGYRAEERRERKKRDTLSPANVLSYITTIYQKTKHKTIQFSEKNIIFYKNFGRSFVVKINFSQVELYATACRIVAYKDIWEILE
jgi:hypothetical protein